MSALAMHSAPSVQMNWPRVSALSGSLSLHLVALGMLLTPAVAITLLERTAPEAVVVRIIQAPPETLPATEPVAPAPVHHVQRHAAPVVHPTIVSTAAVDVPGPAIKVDSDPLPALPGPQLSQEIAPTALAYGTRTRVPYPLEAVRRGEHGTVVLRVLVGIDGNPQSVEIETSSGSPRLDSAARNAVMHWSFRPGTRDGVAHSAWARVPVAFDLSML